MLVSLLVLGAAVAGSVVAADAPSGGGEAGSAGLAAPEEVPELRTATSKTMRNPEGTLTTKVGSRPINFRDAQGDWQPIDNQLRASSAEGYAFENGANEYSVRLPGDLSGRPVRVEHDGAWLSYALEGARAGGEAIDKTARYAGVLPGVDASYTAESDHVKEALTLADAQAESTFSFRVRTSDGLRARERDEGAISFVDEHGEERFAFAPPFMYDSADPRAESRAIAVDLERASDGYVVTLRASRNWLEDPERRFPVVVDPTVFIDPERKCYMVNGTSADTSFCAQPDVKVGYDGTKKHRGLVKFDLSAISSRGEVLYGELSMRSAGGSTSNSSTIDLHAAEKAWTTGATWNRYDGTNAWTSAGGDFNSDVAGSVTTSGSAGNKIWYPTKLVDDWVAGRKDNHGFLIKQSGESVTNVVPFDLQELEVTWKHRTGVRGHYKFETQQLSDRLSAQANVANGNLMLQENDLQIAGTGLGISVSRTYNSLSFSSLSLGDKWTLSTGYDVFLDFFSSSNQTVALAGPSHYWGRFIKKADGSYDPPKGLNAQLVKNADGTWKVTFDQSQEKLHFSSAGRLTKHEDRNGNDLTFAYTGPSGKLGSITDTRNRSVSFAYNTAGYVESMTDSSGRVWAYEYTGARLTKYTNPDGKITRYAYSTAGDLEKVTDPRGNVINFGWDSANRVTSIERVTASTTDTNPTTTFAYSSATSPCDNTKHVRRVVVTDPNGHDTTHCSDREHAVLNTIDARGKDRKQSYDANYNVVKYTSAGAQAWDYTFDTDNRPTQAQQPAAAGQDRLQSTTNYSSTITDKTDPRYHLPTSSDAPHEQGETSLRTTSYGYDSRGNMTSVTDPLAGVIEAAYNADGTVDYIHDPADSANTKTDMTYNANGEMVAIDRPTPLDGDADSGDETFTYDGLSRLDVHTTKKPDTTAFRSENHDYDTLDRLTKITYGDASTVTYAFDANGNMTSRVDAGGTTTYSYDELNRLKQENFPDGSVNKYTYDAVGNLKTLEDAGGTTTYTYGVSNLLDSMRAPNESADTTFSYDDDDRRTSTTYPNGVVMTENYDEPGRLTRIKALKGTTVISDLEYSYLRNPGTANERDSDLRRRVTDHRLSTTTDYTYDNLDRLDTAITAGGDSYDYNYDKYGNITRRTKNSSHTTYQHDLGSNQLCWSASGTPTGACGSPPTGATTYSYNPAGDLLSSSAGRALSYNAKGQTTSLTGPTGGFAYTGEYSGPNQWERTGLGSTDYVNNVLGVGNETKSGATTYYRRDNRSRLHSVRQSSANHYYVFDGLGSIVALTDSTGAASARYTYDPYGSTGNTENGVQNPWRYTGAYMDTGTKLYKMGMRYYDKELGRWTQQDPVETATDAATANRYGYAALDPVNLVDRSGLHPWAGTGEECASTDYSSCNVRPHRDRYMGDDEFAGNVAANTVLLYGCRVVAPAPGLGIGACMVGGMIRGSNLYRDAQDPDDNPRVP